MPVRAVAASVVSIACAVACAAAGAQAPAPGGDPTLYCQGDGGPLGIASDAEHTVLIGDPPLPPGVAESRVDVNGVSTRITQAGPPEAQDAVVFLHGNPGSARDWDALVAANGRFARTVAIDIPGWGKSDKLATQVQSTDGAANYVQGVLDRLGIRRVVLVAHDFGGIWGLEWASQHPDELTGAVLIDTGVLLDYVPHPLAIVWATPVAGELQVASTTRPTFHQAVQYMQPRPLPDAFVDRMYDDYDRATRCALLRYYRSVRDATIPDSNALARKQADALKKRRRPALVIWGAKDPYIPPSEAARQREAFPGARVEIFPDSAHWPFVDNAARTRALVVPFLRPKLSAARPHVRRGARSLRVPVRVTGMLPAYRVRARLERGGGRGPAAAGTSGGGATVSGTSRLVLRLRRPLRAGRYLLTVRALGLPARRFHLRIAAAPARRRMPTASDGQPRFTG